MFTAARSLRVAVARSGNYAVRPTVCSSRRALTYLPAGHSAVLDREEHEHQNQWCVACHPEYSVVLS